MNSTKTFFFMVFALAASVIQTKSPVYQSDIFYEVSQGNIRAVKAWVKSKPDLMIKNSEGQTLLHAVTLAGKNDLVKMLVKAGIAMNAVDNAGKTALDYAAENNQKSIILSLVKYRGNVTTQDNLKIVKSTLKKRILSFAIPAVIFLGLIIYPLVYLCTAPVVCMLSAFNSVLLVGYATVGFVATLIPTCHWISTNRVVQLQKNIII